MGCPVLLYLKKWEQGTIVTDEGEELKAITTDGEQECSWGAIASEEMLLGEEVWMRAVTEECVGGIYPKAS